MPSELVQHNQNRGNNSESNRPAIVSGIVRNNCDLIAQGKVLVRLPSLCKEVWARLTSIGAGPNSGFQFVPRINDEVLVSLNMSDETDAFIIGGVWNNSDRTPTINPLELLVKRVIRTGITGGLGHELEFDDALQSIKITSSTQQKIDIDPTGIEISTVGGTAKIRMDTIGNITIEAALSLNLKAPQIKLEGANVEITGTAKTDVKSTGVCNVNAPLVKIN